MRALLVAALPLAMGCVPTATEEATPPECPAGFDVVGQLCVQRPAGETIVHEGDVVIATAADASAFCAAANAVHGHLTLGPALSDATGLECLRQVAGDLRIEELDQLASLSLPSLRWVGGELSVQVTGPLEALDLPLLDGVGGGLTVHFTGLRTIALPRLATSAAHVSFYANRDLEEIVLPALVQVGSDGGQRDAVLYVRLNENIARTSFPALRHVAGVLKVSSNFSMAELALPALETAGWGLYVSYGESLSAFSIPVRSVDGFLFLANTFATSIDLPNIETVGGELNASHNQFLTALSMPELREVGGAFFVTDNPQLPAEQVQAILDALETVGGPVQTDGNGG